MVTLRFLLLWIGISILVGCGGGGGFTNAGTNSMESQLINTIDLSVGAESVRADGESAVAVRAILTDISGNSASGRNVTFTTTTGNLSSDNARTDTNGIAEVRLIAPTQIGIAKIIASTEGIIQSTTIKFVAGKPTQILVNAVPEIINPKGETTIQARVLDAFYNPIADEIVNFNLPALGSLNTTSAISNSDGLAVANYIAGSDTGIENIQASLSNHTSGLTQIVISTTAITVGNVTLNSGSKNLVADGIQRVVLRAAVTDLNDQPAVGLNVNFFTTAGALQDINGNLQNWAVTDNTGVATLYLLAPKRMGSAIINATVNGFNTTTTINFIAGPAHKITNGLNNIAGNLNAAPAILRPKGTTTLQATVLDVNNNPVAGEVVSFIIKTNNSGGALSTISALSDGNGRATVIYTAGVTSGTDSIMARLTNGASGTTNISINIDAAVVAEITLITGGGESRIADGIGTTAIRATVIDIEGNPVVGAEVNFTTTAGTLSLDKAPTTITGIAETRLTAPKYIGVVTITASAAGFNTTANVTFKAGPPTKITLDATPAAIRPKGTSNLQATVLDQFNNPVVGENVSFTMTNNNSGGKLSASSAPTNSDGQASITYTAGQEGLGEVNFKAQVNNGTSPSATDTVTVANGGITTINLTLGADSLVADGNSSITVRATVTDIDGNPQIGIPVNFDSTAGNFSPSSATTNSNGSAETRLTAPRYIGVAIITASAAGFNATDTLTFNAGVPTKITLKVTPATIPPKGTSTLQATVLDQFNNPVVDQTVSFTMSNNNSGGTLNAVSGITNTDGQASVTYTAGQSGVGETSFQAHLNNGITDTNSVMVETGGLSTIELNLGADSLVADGLSRISVQATVTDSDGNPQRGTKVNFTTTAGKLSATSEVTDSRGIAEVYLTAPKRIGNAAITASAMGFNITKTLNFVSGTPDKILLKSAATIVNPKGKIDIQATVLDKNDNPVEKQTVNFDFFPNQSNASLSNASIITDADGRAVVTYTAGNIAGTDKIRARLANNIEANIQITVAATGIAAKLSIATNQVSVKSDNSNSATITAIALDKNNVVVSGVTINFISNAGQLSAGSVITDANGKAVVTFSSGNDPNNVAPATITASIPETDLTKTIPILIIGTTLTIDAIASNLESGKPINLTIMVKNAGNVAIPYAEVRLSVTGNAKLDKTSGISDANGQVIFILTPNIGPIKISATSLGVTADKEFTVSNPGDAFRITAPIQDPATLNINETLSIQVNAGNSGANNITFVTSLGTWQENNSNLFSAPTDAKIASATLISTQSGISTVRAFDTNNSTQSDIVTVLISAAADQAHHIVLQSNFSTLLPSIGGANRVAELTATVYTENNEPVSKAPVVFSLSNTTSSGEKLDIIYGLTDSAGKIKSNFTSGSLSSGPAGIKITATVYVQEIPVATDSVQININQTAGSVVIGASTVLEDKNNSTSYRLPLTVMVTDSAGAVVPKAVVSLTAWPILYSTGYWTGVNGQNCVATITNSVLNEDLNENVILDPGEDFNLDEILTPPNSAAGAIPATVTTDDNGIFNFDITYLKKYAIWITTRVRAKTLVLGSETMGELLIDPLPVLKEDANKCLVFDSPFGL